MKYSIIQDSRLLRRFVVGSGTLPPNNSYFFDASNNDLEEQIYNKSNNRIIYFGGQQFNDKEEKFTDLMLGLLKSVNHFELTDILPPFYNESKLRGVILQNLYENEFHLEKIKDKIFQQINSRSQILQTKFNENCFKLLVL